MAQRIYSIPCEHGTTGRLLAMRLREYRQNLKAVLQTESTSRYRNYKESTHTA
jgi:hypothetical protein